MYKKEEVLRIISRFLDPLQSMPLSEANPPKEQRNRSRITHVLFQKNIFKVFIFKVLYFIFYFIFYIEEYIKKFNKQTMEKLNQAVTEVFQLLLDQNAELSHLHQENKELKERVEKLEEELRLCKAEIIILNQLKKKNVHIVPQQKLFGWF